MRRHDFMVAVWLRRLALGVAVLAWMALIFYLSSQTREEAGRLLASPIIAWLGVLRSYASHIFLYAILAALFQASIWSWRADAAFKFPWALAAAAISVSYGVSDEYHQSFVSGRTASIEDVLVDGLGALLAVATLAGIWRLNRAKGIVRRPVTPP